MWHRRLAVVAAFAAGLSACGGAASSTGTTTTSSTVKVVRFTYGLTPSTSARMICRHETIADLASVLGVATVRRPVATWVGHTYTCPYVYSDGTMTLSVKELPTLGATLVYVAELRRSLGDTGTVVDVGDGAFTTNNGSAVTRKDNKVLLVDVAQLPAQFGNPATTRAEVALTVTDIILACWRGD